MLLQPLERRVLMSAVAPGVPEPHADTVVVARPLEPRVASNAADELAAHLAEVRSDLPVQGEVLTAVLGSDVGYVGPGRANGVVTVDDPSVVFTDALEVRVTQAGDVPWAVQAIAPDSARSVSAGDVVYASVMVRAVDGGMNDAAVVIPYVQVPGQNYRPIASTTRVVGEANGWQEVAFWGVADQLFQAGQLRFVVHLASQPQTVELGPMVVLNLGSGFNTDDLPVTPVRYGGQALDAAWRADADARIAAHRMADFDIRVVDASGAAVGGAAVDVAMRQHDFRFATFLGSTLHLPGSQAALAEQILLDNFNAVTLPIYWADWGWNSVDGPLTGNYGENLDWFEQQDLQGRAHPILWPSRDPGLMAQAVWEQYDRTGDAGALAAAFDARIDNVLSRLAYLGLLDYDLLNEPRAETAATDIFGEQIIADWFARGAAQTDAALYLNDYGILTQGGAALGNIEQYKRTLTDLIAAAEANGGAGIGGIGFQGHFVGESPTDIPRVIELLDEFAAFGLPLQITEFDLDTLDRDGQGDYVRDFLTAAFANEAVEAFTMWGFYDGDIWRPNIGLWDIDGNPRPGALEWQRLTQEVWWTDEAGTSDVGGKYDGRGFKGTYDVTVEFNGERVVLEDVALGDDGLTLTVQLAQSVGLRGDIDGSGAVDTADLSLLQRLVRGAADDDAAASRADLDGDGNLDADDVRVLYADILGIVAGDANGDGVVNLADFANLSRTFGQSGPLIGWSDGDFNGDGAVNLADFAALSATFGR